jgi:AraC-like DNA-binding protein
MATDMDHGAASGLERSCAAGDRAGWIRSAPPGPGLERIEAYFAGHGFDPHRHDTYAIGFTVRGVQAFRYRGASTCSVPGQVFVLHPDEVHDGRAGTEDGFRYRILYVEPALIRDALAETRRSLPFARDAVTDDPRLLRAVVPALADLDDPLDELQRDRIVQGLADALAAVDPIGGRPLPARDLAAVHRARERLDAAVEAGAGTGVGSAELEAVTGRSRYAVARLFRACLGTSPHRYLVLRRLDRARSLIRAGMPLADAATASGFADQSHMTRQFRRAYGLSPGRWAALAR